MTCPTAVRSKPCAKPLAWPMLALSLALWTCGLQSASAQSHYPVTAAQKSTAQQVAHQGVPLSALAPNAPDMYTVKRGDTLWAISRLFLKSPWRWPELWGMNLDHIRNPHLIYPGQVLVLERDGDRARLRVGRPVGQDKLSPRVRTEAVGPDAISALPRHLIEPFLNQAIVLNDNELAQAPRIVAPPENRVLMGTGDIAYVLGTPFVEGAQRIFREPRPLTSPGSKEILGYEAVYVGIAEFEREGRVISDPSAQPPSTYRITSNKLEVLPGDRLTALSPQDFPQYIPHAPSGEVRGSVISVYGEALMAGKNQIVLIDKGKADGLERGHVLALWSQGRTITERQGEVVKAIRLPDERQGVAMVFRVFDRTAYAVLMESTDAIRRGDTFTQP